jgi:hypothetical protein
MWYSMVIILKKKVPYRYKAMKAQRKSGGKALLFFNLDARWGWVVNVMPQPLHPQQRSSIHCT